MTQRGHTGLEGSSTKVFGALAVLIGLVWMVLAYLIQDAASAVVLPILLVAGGIITFLVGRSLAKAHGGSRG